MLSNTLKGLVNILLAALVTLLAFRFVLKLFGASDNNQIVNWIYSSTAALIEPFNGIFSAIRLQEGFIVELPGLMAIVAYSIIGLIVFSIIDAFSPTYDRRQRSYDSLSRIS